MQLTIIIIAVVLVALIVGFLVGHFRGVRTSNRTFEQYICTHASNEAHFFIRALMLLHYGRHGEAVAFLESQLDGALVTFLPEERLHPQNADDPGTRAVQVARDYRARHPWKSARPEIQDAVQRVLSRVTNAA